MFISVHTCSTLLGSDYSDQRSQPTVSTCGKQIQKQDSEARIKASPFVDYHTETQSHRHVSLWYLQESTYPARSALDVMAGRLPFFQHPEAKPPPPPSDYGTEVYNYRYGFKYPSSTSRLAPGQAPRQAMAPPSAPSKEVVTPAEDITPKEFYCEACDLGLESAQALKSHCRTHVKCSDCPFEGAPKIVKAHYQGRHGKFSGSGFKSVTVAIPGCRVQRFQICVGNRPEDIQRWIDERKKRFPRQQKECSDETAKSTEGPAKETLPGMSSLLAGYGSSGSESEDDNVSAEPRVERVEDKVTSPPPATSAKNDEKPCEETTTSSTAPPPANTSDVKRISRPCQYFSRNGSCLNGDACRFSHDTAVSRLGSPLHDKKRKRGGHTTSDTLLRKLLATDMDRESVLTMQLLEYIVKKNFFGCDS
jgi:hypothetical protein